MESRCWGEDSSLSWCHLFILFVLFITVALGFLTILWKSFKQTSANVVASDMPRPNQENKICHLLARSSVKQKNKTKHSIHIKRIDIKNCTLVTVAFSYKYKRYAINIKRNNERWREHTMNVEGKVYTAKVWKKILKEFWETENYLIYNNAKRMLPFI